MWCPRPHPRGRGHLSRASSTAPPPACDDTPARIGWSNDAPRPQSCRTRALETNHGHSCRLDADRRAGRRRPGPSRHVRSGTGEYAQRRRRRRQPVRVELALGRRRMHERPRSQGLRRRAGGPAAGLRAAEPVDPSVVGGLPAGRLRPQQPDGHGGAVRRDGHHLPQRRGQGVRRRGAQPHGGRQPDHDRFLRRGQLQRVVALLRAARLHGERLPRLSERLPQQQPRDQRLEQPDPGPGVRARVARGPEDREQPRPLDRDRVSEPARRPRRRRLPPRRRQAHQRERPVRDPQRRAQHDVDRIPSVCAAGGHAGRIRRSRAERIRGHGAGDRVHLRHGAEEPVHRQHREPRHSRSELGHRALRLLGHDGDQPRHRAQRVEPQLQGRIHVRARERLPSRVGLRNAAGVCQLHLELDRRLPAVRRERVRHRHRLRERLVLHRPHARRGEHGRLAQRGHRPARRELVQRRCEPHLVQPRQQGLGGHQQRHLRADPHVRDRSPGRQLLRRDPRRLHRIHRRLHRHVDHGRQQRERLGDGTREGRGRPVRPHRNRHADPDADRQQHADAHPDGRPGRGDVHRERRDGIDAGVPGRIHRRAGQLGARVGDPDDAVRLLLDRHGEPAAEHRHPVQVHPEGRIGHRHLGVRQQPHGDHGQRGDRLPHRSAERHHGDAAARAHRRRHVQRERDDDLGQQRVRGRIDPRARQLEHRGRHQDGPGVVPGLVRHGVHPGVHRLPVQVHREGRERRRHLGERREPQLHHRIVRIRDAQRHLEVVPAEPTGCTAPDPAPCSRCSALRRYDREP
ncbi:hypothetical protein MICRO8M_130024 [Microbacterium sp. 8M]|nr:hypothetical protein MICRO8M_130024 [Microbacterium sp. 8M]